MTGQGDLRVYFGFLGIIFSFISAFLQLVEYEEVI